MQIAPVRTNLKSTICEISIIQIEPVSDNVKSGPTHWINYNQREEHRFHQLQLLWRVQIVQYELYKFTQFQKWRGLQIGPVMETVNGTILLWKA